MVEVDETAVELDDQVQVMRVQLRQLEFVRDWFGGALRFWATAAQDESRERSEEIRRQLMNPRKPTARLLSHK